MDMIYENKDRKEEIFQMYQEIFEDPEAFTEYYFEEIYEDNRVLLAQEGEEIRGMIHLNPYRVNAGKREWTLHYIVAVAVREQYRRQGIMAHMLKRCLNDMAQAGEPFTYLMPADRAYYEPFGFVFVMDWMEEQLEGKKTGFRGEISPAVEEEYDRISGFLETFLKKFGVYTVPDQKYLRRTEKESGSSGGNLMTWKQEGSLRGVFAEGYEDDSAFLRWAFSDDPEEMLRQIRNRFQGKKIEITGGNVIQGRPVPKIMARITCLKSWEEILRGRRDFSFRIRIKDPLIPQNNGMFLFDGNSERVNIKKEKEDGDAETILMEDLTRVFFGYDAEKVLTEHLCLRDIIPAGPVYISEEV
nr:GNAT family N-acetyltransferase [uncultured Anaerostipes sp.]